MIKMTKKRISAMNMSELRKERKIIATKLNNPKLKLFSKSAQTLLERDKKILKRMAKL